MSICEVLSEAERDRKQWGSPATIIVDHDDEVMSVSCTDAVSGRRIEFTQLSLVDSYDEVYLLAMAVDFTRTSPVACIFRQGWNCRGWGLTPPPQFMSTDAHF